MLLGVCCYNKVHVWSVQGLTGRVCVLSTQRLTGGNYSCDSLCDTRTSSATFHTPEVTKQSWKLKWPETERGECVRADCIHQTCIKWHAHTQTKLKNTYEKAQHTAGVIQRNHVFSIRYNTPVGLDSRTHTTTHDYHFITDGDIMCMYIVYYDIYVYIMRMHLKAQVQGYNDA